MQMFVELTWCWIEMKMNYTKYQKSLWIFPDSNYRHWWFANFRFDLSYFTEQRHKSNVNPMALIENYYLGSQAASLWKNMTRFKHWRGDEPLQHETKGIHLPGNSGSMQSCSKFQNWYWCQGNELIGVPVVPGHQYLFLNSASKVATPFKEFRWGPSGQWQCGSW